ncbi:MAG TPA: right-handed parallel beta-helix repeat-containing protein, partial [Oceanipulchritudo sp.]|nr:right-handed parallel beta-helix repeat-containing protein [Oceanipulchritudo sp.]
RLIVADTLTVDGRLSANGTAEEGSHNGATGGSIWIETGSLAGSGKIEANAAPKGNNNGNLSSGGGRIAIYYSDRSGFTDLANLEAAGEFERGTIFLFNRDTEAVTAAQRLSVLEGEAERIKDLTVLNGGRVEVYGGAVLNVRNRVAINNGGEIVFRGKNLEPVDGKWIGEGSMLFADEISVAAGGAIHADGEGYWTGPGSSGSGTYSYSSGASYGGRGTLTSMEPYGSAVAPLDLGSSSDDGAFNPRGGGAMVLVANESLHIDGRVSADGYAEGTIHAGATGGSIWIHTGGLTGSGTISADAAPNGRPQSGNSGGGRIALSVVDTFSLPSGNISASGAGDAEDGTIHIATESGIHDIRPLPFILYGTQPMKWMAGILPEGGKARLVARSGQSVIVLHENDRPLEEARVDFRSLPSGPYEIAIQVVDANGAVIRESASSHYVDNQSRFHDRTLTADQTWTNDTVHVIDEGFAVGEGVTLTIEEGVIIKVRSGLFIPVGEAASLNIASNPANPVIITSFRDDAAGGDTNRDGAHSEPALRDWEGIVISADSSLQIPSDTRIRYSRQTWSGFLNESHVLAGGVVHHFTEATSVNPDNRFVVLPGAILKIADGGKILFRGGNPIHFAGTPDAPITVTSVHDDVGGDTNNNGTETLPGPGDYQILDFVRSEGVIEHTHLRFGGAFRDRGVLRFQLGKVTVKNCVIENHLEEGISTAGPAADILVENTVIANVDRGIRSISGLMTLRNVTLDNNRAGIWFTGGILEVENSIITNSIQAGVQHTAGDIANLSVSHSLFWNPGALEGELTSTLEGDFGFDFTSNGNLRADPLLLGGDPYAGLRPSPESP